MAEAIRILGIDPGSRATGFGIVEQSGFDLNFVACGVVHSTPTLSMSERLKEIYQGIRAVINRHNPHYAAIEQVFVARNPNSAIKLGQTRGVLMLAISQASLPLQEFSPKAVKQAVVGYGQAGKEQIQQAVRALLQLSSAPSSDAADALAIAMCCANHLAVSRAAERIIP